MAGTKSARLRIELLVLSGILIGIPLLIFGFYLYIKSTEDRRWAEMRSWCEQAAREARARESRRPVIRGEPVPGNAWDDYGPALPALESARDLREMCTYLDEPAVDRAKARAVADRYESWVQALRRGASRATAQRNIDWETYTDEFYYSAHALANLACLRARFLGEDGRPREAMDLLLDASQYACDVALNGSFADALSSLTMLGLIQIELRRLLVSGKLNREDCRELARALETLDRSFPREAEGRSIEPMLAGFDYLRKGSMEAVQKHLELKDPAKATWRYGFSDRLVLADAFRAEIMLTQRVRDIPRKSWKEARQIMEQIDADRRKTKNPLLQRYQIIQDNLADSLHRNVFRERRAQLRLLRQLACFRATGEIPVLEDPYGDKILSSLNGTRLKLWSVGADGVDDGGTGEWETHKGGKDIVLEVAR